MKKMMNKVKWLLIVCMVFFPIMLIAQGPGDFEEDVLDNPVPFDGGVSLLVAAGIGYGIKKVRDKRKEDKLLK